MSTVAEHLALIEMLRLANLNDAAHQESWLLTNVHWQDLVAMIPSAEMVAARLQTEQRIRDQHPAQAEERIAEWRVKRPAPTTAQEASKAVERQPLTPTPQQYCDAYLYLREREVDLGAGELDHLLSIFGIGPAAQAE